MKRTLLVTSLAFLVGLTAVHVPAQDDNVEPFLGNWALTIPGGGAGHLKVWQEEGYLDADILWGGGSVVPVSFICMHEDTLIIQRTQNIQRRSKDPVRTEIMGNPMDTNDEGQYVFNQQLTNTIIAKVDGDKMDLDLLSPARNSKKVNRAEFSGERIPPLPSAPDLSEVEYGEKINLIEENSLDGWKLLNPDRENGWSVQDGVLINNPVQIPGEDHIHYGNLRTEREFEDFNLTLEVNVPEGSNSGIYLRGIYEVQIFDSHGRSPNSHNMGAIYSRIRPSKSAEKPAGEWQSLNITLCDRHVTVILNDETIIDNQPLEGCTGGAITSNQFVPGPIYLQGDHGKILFRNMELRPIKN